jgi:multidrug resistance efflux pump
MNTREDTYVSAGKELMALVDANSFWKAGYFKENLIAAHSCRSKKP